MASRSGPGMRHINIDCGICEIIMSNNGSSECPPRPTHVTYVPFQTPLDSATRLHGTGNGVYFFLCCCWASWDCSDSDWPSMAGSNFSCFMYLIALWCWLLFIVGDGIKTRAKTFVSLGGLLVKSEAYGVSYVCTLEVETGKHFLTRPEQKFTRPEPEKRQSDQFYPKITRS